MASKTRIHKLDDGNNKELNEFLEPNNAATLRISDHSPEKAYDYFLNFFNIKACDYFDLNSKRPTFDPNRSLVLLHINIRSLHKNFDNLYDFLVELNFLPDVICLTETRIKLHPLLNISLPNYTFFHTDSTSNAGGVGIYVLNKFQVKKSITQYNFSKSECLWLDISENNFKTELTVGAVYRHPGLTKIIEFINEFTNSLADLSQNKKVYYILGDFNINLNRDNRTNSANLYINSILSHDAIPLITKPTRISNNSSTIIDHIITNDSKHELQSFIVKSDLTDHYPIFCVIKKIPLTIKKI